MANNYTQSSSFIRVPAAKIAAARKIVKRVENELENSEDGYVGFVAEVEIRAGFSGVWIHEEESISPAHVATLVEALVDELKLPGIHICSWAYTCSKPRVDEFGGGAFAVERGRNTIWIDAASEVQRLTQMRRRVCQET